MTLETKLEAILFFKNEPLSIKKLAEILKAKEGEVKDAIFNLKRNLEGRGIVLQEKDDEISLGTAREYSALIENLQKEELSKELSKASLEARSIVLYKGGANRAEIDYIRGVNSSFTLRALSVRGLVERITDPRDARRFFYRPSFGLLSYLGIKSIEELPEFAEVNKELLGAEEQAKEAGKDE